MNSKVAKVADEVSVRKRSRKAPPSDSGAKAAILAAAFTAFARDGFDGASIPKIAEAAGVAHPLIHYHFGTKENLWKQTVDEAFGSLNREAALIESASRTLAPLDRLRVLIRAFTHFAARYPDHFALIMTEARSDTQRLSWLREIYADAFLERLQAILREAQDAGQIRKIPVEHLSFILMGAMLLFFSANFHLSPDADMEALADAHAEYVTQALLSGIALGG